MFEYINGLFEVRNMSKKIKRHKEMAVLSQKYENVSHSFGRFEFWFCRRLKDLPIIIPCKIYLTSISLWIDTPKVSC